MYTGLPLYFQNPTSFNLSFSRLNATKKKNSRFFSIFPYYIATWSVQNTCIHFMCNVCLWSFLENFNCRKETRRTETYTPELDGLLIKSPWTDITECETELETGTIMKNGCSTDVIFYNICSRAECTAVQNIG